MDSIEKGIRDIDQHTKTAIQKHKAILAKSFFDPTIYETAEKSNKSSSGFDRSCKRIFADVDSIGEVDAAAFNPHTVVEFRDGKSHQVIEDWDKDYGILPNRKVTGTYYVDVVTGSDGTG